MLDLIPIAVGLYLLGCIVFELRRIAQGLEDFVDDQANSAAVEDITERERFERYMETLT